ncbi:MAG: adenylate/guanylate cyclase domain-containing protein [Actinomycetota bacterium]
MNGGATFSAQELASRAGIAAAELGQLVELQILQPDTEGRFQDWEVGVIRLTRAFEEGGISRDAISRAIADGHFSFAFVQYIFREGYRGLTEETFEELCRAAGANLEFIQQVFTAAGLPTPRPGDRMRVEDAERIPSLSAALSFGSGDPALLLRGVRIMGESMHRVAESQPYIYHHLMEEPLLASGMSEREMRDLITVLSPQLGEIAERAVVWMYRRHEEHAIIEHLLEHLYGLMERIGLQESGPEHPPAMCFLDLVGYTRLTEERGDEAAAQTVATLAEVARATTAPHQGRPVKWLGDGVMFHFHDPQGAVSAALEMVERIPSEGLPPAHVGIAAGPIIARDGDYFGRTVNMASRIASYAGPGQVLVTDTVVTNGPAHVHFEDIGPVRLKGISDPIRLHRAEHVG